MRIAIAYPPLYERIDAAFSVAGKPVIFCFGDTIFNPMGVPITRELMAHEEIHSERQGAEVLDWWERYLADSGFRYLEELPAHAAEYRAYCKRHGSGRDKYLNAIAQRLASPLYGNVVGVEAAKLAILTARAT